MIRTKGKAFVTMVSHAIAHKDTSFGPKIHFMVVIGLYVGTRTTCTTKYFQRIVVRLLLKRTSNSDLLPKIVVGSLLTR